MPILVSYVIKLSCCLAAVYLFYYLVLRWLTFYTANRWYLLGYSLLSFFMPLINISAWLQQPKTASVVRFVPAVDAYTAAVPATATHAISVWQICLCIFVAGVLFFAQRLAVQYWSYRQLKGRVQPLFNNGIAVYQVSGAVTPFSFGRSIFINPQQHSESELREIIRHEIVHVKQRHTIDIIWAELVCILNWYNPVVWLWRRAVRENLEFIADSQVLRSGVDTKTYQYLLLKVMDAPEFRLGASFNFSSLKKRIVMMNKLKTAKVHLLKFLFLLPMVALLLLAFRNVASKHPQHGDLKKFVSQTKPGSDTTAPSQLQRVVLVDRVRPGAPASQPANEREDYINHTTEPYLVFKDEADAKKKYGTNETALEIFVKTKPDRDTVPPPPFVTVPDTPDITLSPIEEVQLEELPDDYKAFMDRNPQVAGINWNQKQMVIELKSGKRETYLRNDPKSMAAAERKWGKLPAAPPPPPPTIAPPPPPPVKNKRTTETTQALLEKLKGENEALKQQILAQSKNDNNDDAIAKVHARDKQLQEQSAKLLKLQQENQLVQMQDQQQRLLQFKEKQVAMQQRQKIALDQYQKKQLVELGQLDKKQVEVQKNIKLLKKQAQLNLEQLKQQRDSAQ